MDERTEELRHAHDVLAEVYVERLAGVFERMPVERALLGLFADLVRDGDDVTVGDLGCGTGRLAPFLRSRGWVPRGVDLSPEMVRVAARDQPGLDVQVGDLRALPFEDASLDGALAWYSLMYLPPDDRGRAFAEIARVLRPGAPLAMAWKLGDDRVRRGGKTLDLGIGFDIWWHSHDDVTRRLDEAGLDVVLRAERPPEAGEVQPQGYVVARRR